MMINDQDFKVVGGWDNVTQERGFRKLNTAEIICKLGRGGLKYCSLKKYYWWERIDSDKIGAGDDGPGITIRRWKQSLRDDL